MFSYKLTKKGTQNPAFTSIEHVMNDYISIAASGDEKTADCVRITRARLGMNEYYSPDGRLISYPRIQASFVNRIKREEMKYQATYEAEFVIGKMNYEMDRDGNVTDKYIVQGIVPQWGGKVDVIPFYTSTPAVTEVLVDNWSDGDSVHASGRLNFTSTVETKEIQLGFGEPRIETHTVNLSQILITGGDKVPLDETMAFDREEVAQALAERKNRLAALKASGAARASQKKTPAPSTSVGKGLDLGF